MNRFDVPFADHPGFAVSPYFGRMVAYMQSLQEQICDALQERDGREFTQEIWRRDGGGGGLTRVLCGGHLVEKGGVNTAMVHGELSAEAAQRLETSVGMFAACGISLVIHPRSPRIPSVHMNVRRFELATGDAWYGGGIDITPYYPHVSDCVDFHRELQQACNSVIPGAYWEFKKHCDEYFYLPHRGEMRGAGGIFFDYLRNDDNTHAVLIESVGSSFLRAFLPIVDRRIEEQYCEEDRGFQLMRRGRYVEFNLLYDRGTHFGLKTGGRTESIFMSLPPEVAFPHNWTPKANSAHKKMQKFYQPQDWSQGFA